MNIKKIAPAPNAFQYPLLIKSLLSYSLVLAPEREIIYRDIIRYNYHELNRRVRKFANLLQRLGLNGGETVAVMDYDSHRYLEAYFAIPMTGNVLHTINWRLSPAQVLYTINHAEDVVLIANADFLPVLEGFAGQMPTIKKIILTTDTGTLPNTTLPVVGEYETLLATQPDVYEFEDFEEDAIATTFYTTGTTGNPKGVFFTHRQLVLHTLGITGTFSFAGGAACRITADDTYMPLTPMFHVHAWGFPYVATTFCLKQVYIGKFEPEMVCRLFAQEKPTISHCVPTILQMLVMHPAAQALNLKGWKVIIGGSAFPKSLCEAALKRGADVISAYGMSETCPLVTTVFISKADAENGIDWQVSARTRTGIPCILTDLKVVDEAGQEVPKDDETMGEIVVRTPWLTQGYFKDEEKGVELWRGGYLHTGDVATLDAQNSLKIADRIKDVIKSGGEWVSSIDLENLIGQHEAVAEVAVIGIADAKWGERPHAMIVLKPGKTLTKEELKTFMQQFVASGQITAWTVPNSVEFVAAIPRTSVGKIDKKVIRASLHNA